MVSILSRVFGLTQIDIIEDAVQDSFYKAIKSWKVKYPDNPEAWLMQASKNRIIDIHRKLKADRERVSAISNGSASISIDNMFLPHEVADSQLRMIFACCDPGLSQEDQIAIALKYISGFSVDEISTALLTRRETIKKRLTRAKQKMRDGLIKLEIPSGLDLSQRLEVVHQVIYLIFNEGYQSAHHPSLIREHLCTEAMRLAHFLTGAKSVTQKGDSYALLALLCFHSARLDSKIDCNNSFIALDDQDRTMWDKQLVLLGNSYMDKAMTEAGPGQYHYEAAIIHEHLIAASVEETNWAQILKWYQALLILQPTDFIRLNLAIVYIQLDRYNDAEKILSVIDVDLLDTRKNLFFATYSDLNAKKGLIDQSRFLLQKAIKHTIHPFEIEFLQKKLSQLDE